MRKYQDCWITGPLMATWRLVVASLALMTLTTTTTYGLVLEGSQTSYAQFRQWHGGNNDTLTFEFSTNQTDALLLYSDNNQEKEYLQIKLVGGNVMLRWVYSFFYLFHTWSRLLQYVEKNSANQNLQRHFPHLNVKIEIRDRKPSVLTCILNEKIVKSPLLPEFPLFTMSDIKIAIAHCTRS